LETKDEHSVVGLEGAIGIAQAAELKQLLVQALQSGFPVRVSLESATELDVTAVELLWAAEREARGSGVEFALKGQVPQGLLTVLAEAGFEKFPIPVEVS
jgi:anti-anti-sigma regulatory factor